MTSVAKALGISVPQAHLLFRVPKGAKTHYAAQVNNWHTVKAHHGLGRTWESDVSVNPEYGKIIYHSGFGVPGTGGAVHTIRSLIAARDMGLKSAHIHTALGGEQGNGAYTHPRIGFTGDVEADKYPHYDKIHQLMQNPEAREWWRRNHKTLRNLHFDLTPGSESFQRLEQYLREKKASSR